MKFNIITHIWILLILSISDGVNAQEASTGELLLPRYGPSAVTDGQWVYVYGGSPHGGRNGEDFSHQGLHATIERVDPKTLQSTYFSNGLYRRANHASVILDEKLITCGGRSQFGLSRPKIFSCEYLDLNTGIFKEFPALKEAVRTLGMVDINGDLYVIGGVLEGSNYSASIYRLLKDSIDWEYLSDAPYSVSGQAVAIGNEIYVIGGYNGKPLNTVLVFDVSNLNWQKRKNLPYPLSAYSVVTDGNSIYIFGDYKRMDAIHRYDPITGNLYLLDRQMTPRRHTAAVAIDDKILVIGGNQTSSGKALNIIEAFTYSGLQNSNEVLVQQP